MKALPVKRPVYLNPDMEELVEATKGANAMIELPERLRKKKAKTSYYGGTGYTYEKCVHYGDKVVFEKDGKKLYAASGGGLKDAIREGKGKWDLIIDLANNITATSFISARSSKRFEPLKAYTYGAGQIKSEVLQLDWPDMGIAPATIDFWRNLWEMLPEKTVVACMGGHGRTGTCLAALMIASGEAYEDAVKHVRKMHCKEAVESHSQESYLHRLYCDLLTQLIADPDNGLTKEETAELQAELEAAKASAPTGFSGHKKYADHGGNSVPVWGTVGAGTKTDPPKKSAVEDAQELLDRETGWRHSGNIIEVYVCVEKTCTLGEKCVTQSHMGWTPFDPETQPWAH